MSRASPEAMALASANWLAWWSASSSERMLRSPESAAAMNRALRSLVCHIVASIETQCGVGADFDLAVLIALPFDAAFPLLDLRRQPGHVEMVQGFEAQLHVHTGAHCLGRADQDAHAPGVELVEQALLVGGALEVLHKGDLGSRYAEPYELVLDPAVSGEAAFRFDADRAEVREDQLSGAGDRKRGVVRPSVAAAG